MKTENGRSILDEVDRAILQKLRRNARKTYTEIGRSLNLAHSTVYDRIRKLEDKGIIQKYTILTNPEKLGLKRLTAIVTVFTSPQESERVAGQLSRYEQIVEVLTSLSEELAVITRVKAEDQEDLHTLIAEHIAPLPGVLRIRTSIITRKYKQDILAF